MRLGAYQFPGGGDLERNFAHILRGQKAVPPSAPAASTRRHRPQDPAFRSEPQKIRKSKAVSLDFPLFR